MGLRFVCKAIGFTVYEGSSKYDTHFYNEATVTNVINFICEKGKKAKFDNKRTN